VACIRTAAAALAVALAVFVSNANAEQTEPCGSRVTRANVVRCALGASLSVQLERQELSAATARKAAASPLLPDNPVLAISAAQRRTSDQRDINWYATLSQQLEVAGQRGLRRDAAEASVGAQSQRVVASRRATAVQAWASYFDALASIEERRLTERLVVVSERVAAVARARAESGLIAGVDADVADAAAVRVLQVSLAAERRVVERSAQLASLLGLEPKPSMLTIEGELTPLAESIRALAAENTPLDQARPELLALEAEQRALELRAAAFRRSRVPNPTLSVFAQNDGFNERVFGVGLSLPIPLPGNVGRTYIGEIAEAEALAQRTHTERAQVVRELKLSVSTARQVFASRAREVEAFTAVRLSRAESGLSALAEQIEAGRISVRDALIAQQALIELLLAHVDARKNWCLASVELARALGLPLEGAKP